MSELLFSERGTANDINPCNVVISKNSVDIQEPSEIEYIVAEVDPVVISNFHEDNSLCYEEDYTTFSETLKGDETPYPVYLVKSSNFEETDSERQETFNFTNEVAILPDSCLSNSVEYLENDAVQPTYQTNTTFVDNHSREGFSKFCLESASFRYKDQYSISNIVNDRKKKSKVGRSLFRRIKPYERKNSLPNAQKNSHLTQNWNLITKQEKGITERTHKYVPRNNREILSAYEDCFPCYKNEILNNKNCKSSLPVEKEDLPNKLRTSVSSLLSKKTFIDAHKCTSNSKINGNLLYKNYPVLKNSDKKLSKKTSRSGNSKSTSDTHSVKIQSQTNKNDLLAFDLKDALRSDTSELKLTPKTKKAFTHLGSRKPQKLFKSSFYNILSENMASSNSAAYSTDDREGSGLYTEVTEQLQYINMLCAQIQEAEQKRPLSRTVKEQETNATTNSVTATLQSKSKDTDKKDFRIKQDLLLEERKRSIPVLKLQDIQEVIGPISQDQSIKVSDYLKKIKTKCKQTVQNIDKSLISGERSELSKKPNINNVKQKDGNNASLKVSLTSDHKINRGSEPLSTSLRNGQTMRSLRKRSYDSSELKTSDDKKTQATDRNVKKSKTSRSSSDSELIQAKSDNSVEPSAFLNFIGKPDLSVHCFSNFDSKSRKKVSVNEMPMLLDETVADNAENSRTRLRNKLQKMPKLVQEKLEAEKVNKLKQNKVGDLQQSKNITINTTIRKLACSSSVENLHYRSNSRKISHKNDSKIKSNNKSEYNVNIQKTAKSNETLNLEKKASLPKQNDRDLEYQMMDTPTLVKLRSRVQSAPKIGVATSPLKLHVKKGISKEIFSKYKPQIDDKMVCIKSGNSIKQKTDKRIDTSKDVICKSNTEVKDIKVVLHRLDEGIKIMPSTTESRDEVQLKNIHSSATPQLSQGICCMCNKQNRNLWPTNKVKRSKSISISMSSRMESLKNQIKELSEILQKSNKKRLISSRNFSKNSEELKDACNELTEILNFTCGDLQKCVASECTSNSVSDTNEAAMPVCISDEIVLEDHGLSKHMLTPTTGNTSDLIDNKEGNNNSNFESVNRTELLNHINRYHLSEDENAAEVIQELLASLINQLQSSEIKSIVSECSDSEMQIATVINPKEELITVQINDLELQTENLEENESKLVTNVILSTEQNEDEVSKRMDPIFLKSENEHRVVDESITNVIVSVLDQVSCLDDKDLCKTSLEMVSNVEEEPCETEDFTEEIDGLNEEIEDYAMKRDSDYSDDYLPDNEFFVLDSWESEESDKSKDKTNYCNGGLLNEISNFDNFQADEIIEEKEEIVKELLTTLINKI